MAMSVRERIKEVGVLKTLGFTNSGVLSIIVGEALAIAFVGGVIGLLLASVLGFLVTKSGANLILQVPSLNMNVFTAIACLVVALFIGFVSSFIPAWNAARTNILDSLRYSG
jgi:putative ABC transport system permease protein